MRVVPLTAVEALNQVRSDLSLEQTRTIGELHQLYEKVAALEARKQRLQERINAIDEAVFVLREEDE